MEDSRKPTSRVIDSLHSEIDELKNELEIARLAKEEYKKKHLVESKKNESYVDQLANAKHENDMVNALLKRKERRVADLEEQYNDLNSSNETLLLNNKNMKIRCENLQESSALSTAEYERLKIAYDALLASQVEYKKHYQKEIHNLTSQFEKYKKESSERFESLSDNLSSNDRDIDTLLDSLTNKRKTMDNLYVNKNRAVLELLSKLAKAANIHGHSSKSILQNNVEVIRFLVEKYPELQSKLLHQENFDVDLDELLNESNEALSNSSFDEEATLINSPDPSNDLKNLNIKSGLKNNNIQQKKRKNNSKRNSMRFDLKSSLDFAQSHLNVPKRNSNLQKIRNTSGDSQSRTPTPPSNINGDSSRRDKSGAPSNSFGSNRQKSNSKNSKRRSLYIDNSAKA
ncbi:uncharacterized protein PRCAT00006175001 [Priceomyces carsonii]|uniref:uncharacterized protein n=1 Tax=Priceomyces carsonii TaxID=28549 RepID=UPI002ED92E5A|nr:unnamed protein product [Priceomyces carsonii]